MKLLIAEDDADDLELIQRTLDLVAPGIPTESFRDGRELWKYLDQQNGTQETFLILLDLNMPRMDGREVLRAFHERQADFTRRVVVFTTSSEITDRESALALGADEVVVKPSSFKVFMAEVKGILQRANVQVA